MFGKHYAFALILLCLFATPAYAQQSLQPGQSVTITATLPDSDGDGVPNQLETYDLCEGYPDSVDTDSDGTPDGDQQGEKCDTDDDGDGRADAQDYSPLDPTVQDKPRDCNGVDVAADADIDATVAKDPTATYCLSGGTYRTDKLIVLRDGGKLVGETGEIAQRGLASYGIPATKILPADGVRLDNLVSRRGAGTQLRWLDISGATGRVDTPSREADGTGCPQPNMPPDAKLCPTNGTGNAVNDGQTTKDTLTKYSVIHDNDVSGISNAQGQVLYSEFYSNTEDLRFEGYNGASIKTIREMEIAFNYIHDEQANGLWADQGTRDQADQPEGFYVHHNLVERVDRHALKYEFSPMVAEGVHRDQPTALIEGNVLKGNRQSGVHISDSQNATVRANDISGTRSGKAIIFSDSGRSDRTDLWNGTATGNLLNGERIVGCNLAAVSCSENTP